MGAGSQISPQNNWFPIYQTRQHWTTQKEKAPISQGFLYCVVPCWIITWCRRPGPHFLNNYLYLLVFINVVFLTYPQKHPQKFLLPSQIKQSLRIREALVNCALFATFGKTANENNMLHGQFPRACMPACVEVVGRTRRFLLIAVTLEQPFTSSWGKFTPVAFPSLWGAGKLGKARLHNFDFKRLLRCRV